MYVVDHYLGSLKTWKLALSKHVVSQVRDQASSLYFISTRVVFD